MIHVNTNNKNPNFTVVLPGPCNSKCGFCKWEEEQDTEGFLPSLEYALNNLPPMFTQISITGGEPTISPYFKEALYIISKHRDRFNKVVLTTNGSNLVKENSNLRHLKRTIDHINISRHHHNDKLNKAIFKTGNIPEKFNLKRIANEIHRLTNIDITYNCVMQDNIPQSFPMWLNFMNYTGIKTVSFRNQYDNYSENKMEQYFLDQGLKPVQESECPVCKTDIFGVAGYKFKFHKSDYEPTETFKQKGLFDETYELILQSNGNITRDWEGKKLVYTAEKTVDSFQLNALIKAGNGPERFAGSDGRLRPRSTEIINNVVQRILNEHTPEDLNNIEIDQSYTTCGGGYRGC